MSMTRGMLRAKEWSFRDREGQETVPIDANLLHPTRARENNELGMHKLNGMM